MVDAARQGAGVSLCQQLRAAQRDEGNPDRFEQVVADVLNHVGLGAMRIGGEGETEVLVRSPVAAIPATFLVDVQPSRSGVVERSRIRWAGLAVQRELLHAKFVVVVGESFEPGLAEWAARERRVPMVETRLLCALMLRHARQPLTYAELWGSFAPAEAQPGETVAGEYARRKRSIAERAVAARPWRPSTNQVAGAANGAVVQETAARFDERGFRRRGLASSAGDPDAFAGPPAGRPALSYPQLADEAIWHDVGAPAPARRRRVVRDRISRGGWIAGTAASLFLIGSSLTNCYQRPTFFEPVQHVYRLDVPPGLVARTGQTQVEISSDVPSDGELRVRVDGITRRTPFVPGPSPTTFSVPIGSRVEVIGVRDDSRRGAVTYLIDFPSFNRSLRSAVSIGTRDIYEVGPPR